MKVSSILAALAASGSVVAPSVAAASVEGRFARTQPAAAERADADSGRKSRGGQRGVASYYWQNQRTATGERFNPNGLTAAHRTLPLGTVVRVTNHRNGNSVRVRINDRGPYVRGRVIDLSRAAAQRIGMISSGLAPVTVQVVD
nr:septal ring lytic transglycosylase RlpA family protein [Blastochloris sulfoviridis]